MLDGEGARRRIDGIPEARGPGTWRGIVEGEGVEVEEAIGYGPASGQFLGVVGVGRRQICVVGGYGRRNLVVVAKAKGERWSAWVAAFGSLGTDDIKSRVMKCGWVGADGDGQASMGGLKKRKERRKEEEKPRDGELQEQQQQQECRWGCGWMDGWVDCENMCNLSCARAGVLCMYVCMQNEGNESPSL